MTRLIERWFPCKEVSENSRSGWGSGNAEKELFPWFAARPLVQAKAAVICSLLPWPDDPAEQKRLQDLVRRAMEGYDAAHDEVVAEINKHYPDGASLLDSFSGRAMIPLEAARLGIRAWGIEYSPVAALAGTLLADYPLRDWSQELPLPFDGYETNDIDRATTPRLLYDVQYILGLIGRRYEIEMGPFYPMVNGKRPWGYLWAITLPCSNCGRRFPFTASLELRRPRLQKKDLGQSYYIEADSLTNNFRVVIHEGKPIRSPTLIKKAGSKGRVAICPFCDHVLPFDNYTRLMGDGYAEDTLLLVADVHARGRKTYREVTQVDLNAIDDAIDAVKLEPPFASGLPAIPHERAFGSTGPRDFVRYGYHTYGDFWNSRQTLGLIRLSRIINDLGKELINSSISSDYALTLIGYAASVLARTIRTTTRGCTLQVTSQSSGHIFGAGPPVPFGYDYFETGCGEGSGTWLSVSKSTIRTLKKQLDRISGCPAHILQGTATDLPITSATLDAVVTDPPYAEMVEYSDASDLFYVWLKRALSTSNPEFGITANPVGVQDKTEEAVVKMSWNRSGDHRTPDHYDFQITTALTEARRVIKSDGVVSIMFGHDNPDVWKRFLTSIDKAGLMLTGSWPARTERGKQLNKAQIEITLTLACRPTPDDRPKGRMLDVEAQVKKEVLARIPLWQASGLAFSDQLMASYGPAMEVVGRYSEIRDKAGKVVTIDRYLPKARRYVGEAADIKIGDTPLDSFDIRSRFGLFWSYMFGRSIVPGSEVRWSRLTWDMAVDDIDGLLHKEQKGFRLIYGREVGDTSKPRNGIIDTALAVAAVGKSSRDIADILVATNRVDDDSLWNSMGHLAKNLSKTDCDGDVWTWALRNRNAISNYSEEIIGDKLFEQKLSEDTGIQPGML